MAERGLVSFWSVVKLQVRESDMLEVETVGTFQAKDLSALKVSK